MCESTLRRGETSFNYHMLVTGYGVRADTRQGEPSEILPPQPTPHRWKACGSRSFCLLVETSVHTIKRMIGHFHAPSAFDLGLMLTLAVLAATGLYFGS
jgi:hypothetical protein